MKYYKLLRNNKETGPFSAEDLIKTGFKAYDLIWEEGKSAAWRYPSEIPEFKNYSPVVEEQPFDRFYKKQPATSQPTRENPVETRTMPEAVKKEKPRIRIKAESRVIEENNARPSFTAAQPTKTVLNVPAINKPEEEQKKTNTHITATPEWERMWLDWEQEKKTVDALKFQDKEPEIETKFSQSLDDLKERYVEKVLKDRQPSFSFDRYKNYVAIIVISGLVLAMGIWMGVKWSSNEETRRHLQAKQHNTVEQQQPTSESTEDVAPGDNINELSSESSSPEVIVVPAVEKNSSANNSTMKQKKPATGKVSVSLPQNTQKPSTVSNKTKKVTNTLATSDRISKDMQKASPHNSPTREKEDRPVVKMPVSAKKAINDYVSIRDFSGSGAVGVVYKVDNISDINIELVMIDLQYYDPAGRYQKGETVYVRNISPGQTVSVKAPSDVSASKITSTISMISSEQENLYLIAE